MPSSKAALARGLGAGPATGALLDGEDLTRSWRRRNGDTSVRRGRLGMEAATT